jgi:hypothetical protein
MLWIILHRSVSTCNSEDRVQMYLINALYEVSTLDLYQGLYEYELTMTMPMPMAVS